MNRSRVVTPLALAGLGGLAYVSISANTSDAQVQLKGSEAEMSAKVARLERQVERLQEKVEQLERRPVALQAFPSAPYGEGNKIPPSWSPFSFNGQTYYLTPAEKKEKRPAPVTPNK
jgi:hypothetical protein